MVDPSISRDRPSPSHLLTGGTEGANRKAGHPEGQDACGDRNHPCLRAVCSGGDPGEEEGQEGEEDALCAALSCPGHAASLLVVLLLVLGFGLLRLGVLAVLERLVGHAGDVPEMAHLQSNVSPGA